MEHLFQQITEEEYRQLPHISYSKISKFISGGPASLIKKQDSEKTNNMLLGNLFDTLLTEPNKISEKYFIGETSLTDKQIKIIQNIRQDSLPEDTELIKLFNKFEFYSTYTDKTRLVKFLTNETDIINYLKACKTNENLYYISKSEFNFVSEKVTLLKTHPFTKDIFDNDLCELFFQAKVVSNDLSAKCMFDLVVIDHVHQVIFPIDFKFMEDSARTFMRSFERFNYYIQDTLYTDVLDYELKKLKLDYTIMEMTFIVVSQKDNIILQYVPEIDVLNENEVAVNNRIKKSWQYYLNEIKWHLGYQIFDYTREEYENKGIICIPSTKTNLTTNYTDYETLTTTDFPKDDLPF